MITAIDANVLLDVLNRDETYFDTSKELLGQAYQQGALIISDVVYAELASQFEDVTKLDQFLEETGIVLKPFTKEALQMASKAWHRYSAKRSPALQCPRCGKRTLVNCEIRAS